MRIEHTLIARANGTWEVGGSNRLGAYATLYHARKNLIRAAWFLGNYAQPAPPYVLLTIHYPGGVETPPWVKGSSEQISVSIWRPV